MDTEINDATAAENNPVYGPLVSVNEALGVEDNDAQR
jgi:hypothetical protein